MVKSFWVERYVDIILIYCICGDVIFYDEVIFRWMVSEFICVDGKCIIVGDNILFMNDGCFL